jgi:HlyD family secretion protein
LQLRERMAAARAQLDRTLIRSQSAGVVLVRNVEPGDLVQPGRVLFEIARDGNTEIEVLVDEKNLAQLAIGQQAQCVADAWPDRPFPATVRFIAPAIDPARGTVIVRLAVDPVPEFLRQDMTVSVNVETGRLDQALAVPNDALLDAGAVVLVARDGRVARVPVRTGLAGLAMTEIVEGLVAGDLVLADAAGVTTGEGGRVRAEAGALPAPDATASSRRELPVQFD